MTADREIGGARISGEEDELPARALALPGQLEAIVTESESVQASGMVP
jgi:hypothetical protein